RAQRQRPGTDSVGRLPLGTAGQESADVVRQLGCGLPGDDSRPRRRRRRGLRRLRLPEPRPARGAACRRAPRPGLRDDPRGELPRAGAALVLPPARHPRRDQSRRHRQDPERARPRPPVRRSVLRRTRLILHGRVTMRAIPWARMQSVMAVVLALAVPVASAAAPLCGIRDAPPPVWEHVVWIWFENHGSDQVIGSADAPFMNRTLAAGCGLATNAHNETHPSLPNYIAATSGLPPWALRRWKHDCNAVGPCRTRAANLFAQA